jgi:MFS family permease
MSLSEVDREKQGPEVAHLDHEGKHEFGRGNAGEVSSDTYDDDHGFTPKEQRSIIRRIDRRLVVTVGALYCVSLMDRTNMSFANIAGMDAELKLGNNYNIANLVFFVPYIIFQPPSTVIIRAIGARIHLSTITVAWGAVMIGMGFVQNHSQLSGLRALLGVFEAGFFPACVYLLSTWYTRFEIGKRYSVFYLLGCVASAFAGILAYGLSQLGGREGITAWRWIFIVEGALTCALGIAAYWLLVDFPDSNRKTWSFLGQRERQWVVSRIARDRGDQVVEKFNILKFLSAGKDWKIWAYALIFFGSTTLSYAIAYTLPIILNQQLGFTVAASQCLAAPLYTLAGILMFATAWVGDKYHIRGPIIIINMVIALIGLPILGWHKDPAVRFFGCFLLTAGANSNIPAVMSFQANNIRGQWKRAFCSATLVGFGGIGGIVGSLAFRAEDAPTGYKPGIWTCIACVLMNICLVIICDLDFKRQNAKADRGEVILEAHDDDASPDFRYTY